MYLHITYSKENKNRGSQNERSELTTIVKE